MCRAGFPSAGRSAPAGISRVGRERGTPGPSGHAVLCAAQDTAVQSQEAAPGGCRDSRGPLPGEGTAAAAAGPPGLLSAAALPCLRAGAGAEALRLPAGGSPGRGGDPSAPAVRKQPAGEGGPGGPAPPRGRSQRQDGERRGLLRLRRKPRCCRSLRKALV